ncbi:MAG: lytic murein transglycosylase B [Betaproteobacteria bacterium]|nr:lytic murein transglycosylase B [Betaproteobacteria bacterium]
MRIIALAVLLACAAGFPAQARDVFSQRTDVKTFIRDMAERHAFPESELQFLFTRARRIESVLKAITPPKDPRGRSWRIYRERFVNEVRIGEGLVFWSRHADVLARAAEAYGVPEEIIVAIIGVETLYGRNAGSFRVIDALSTLAFHYPPRASYFRSELEQYLLFTRDAGLDVFSVKGSYAGAIGIPQFMPGSYRRFAVDFDGDGTIDLRGSPADAVGSVANFLREHGWLRGELVQLPAQVSGDAHHVMLEAGILPGRFTLASLREHGVGTRSSLPLDTAVALIDLPTPGAATEYRLGLRNFYVLTRYNRSSFYAAAVHDLAQELRQRR